MKSGKLAMLPNLSYVLNSFSQSLTLIEVTQEIVDYKPINVETSTQIDAVVQVAESDKLTKLYGNKIDLSKRYLQVHTKEVLKNIYMCIYQGIRYKIFSVNNYSDYGYYEALFEDIKSA